MAHRNHVRNRMPAKNTLTRPHIWPTIFAAFAPCLLTLCPATAPAYQAYAKSLTLIDPSNQIR